MVSGWMIWFVVGLYGFVVGWYGLWLDKMVYGWIILFVVGWYGLWLDDMVLWLDDMVWFGLNGLWLSMVNDETNILFMNQYFMRLVSVSDKFKGFKIFMHWNQTLIL